MSKRVLNQPGRHCVCLVVIKHDGYNFTRKRFRANSIREAMRFLGIGTGKFYNMLTNSHKVYFIGEYMVSASYLLIGTELPIPDKSLEDGGFYVS